MNKNIWIGIVVIIVLAAGGWWYLDNSHTHNSSLVSDNTNQPTDTQANANSLPTHGVDTAQPTYQEIQTIGGVAEIASTTIAGMLAAGLPPDKMTDSNGNSIVYQVSGTVLKKFTMVGIKNATHPNNYNYLYAVIQDGNSGVVLFDSTSVPLSYSSMQIGGEYIVRGGWVNLECDGSSMSVKDVADFCNKIGTTETNIPMIVAVPLTPESTVIPL